MKRFVALLLIAVSVLALASCGSVIDADAKDFSGEGMTITLTEGFTETKMDGYTLCYDSKEIAVFALKESFSLAAGFGDYTLAEYADLVHTANAARNPGDITDIEGLTCMEYTFDNNGTVYSYLSVMYKASDAFWLVQFTCKQADYEAFKPHMITWAKSVKFAG